MHKTSHSPSRKKFLWWGTAALAALTTFRFFGGRKKSKTETVKMLTEDGRLVEIDKKMLTNSGKKITNQELQQSIKK